QGYVDHIGVPASTLTATSATVVFVAPDSQACPVDFKVYDPTDPNTINGFTRVPDTGTSNRVRKVNLTGLATATTYQYRIDCSVVQPSGFFKTK
ncbi:MAG: hypothetical protein JO028_05315, partial [Acidobacteriaceae bacterium]|nr:hypothetical protein [Acidobacteriaceae bacterium]